MATKPAIVAAAITTGSTSRLIPILIGSERGLVQPPNEVCASSCGRGNGFFNTAGSTCAVTQTGVATYCCEKR